MILLSLIAGAIGIGTVFSVVPLVLGAARCVPSLQRKRDLHHTHRQPIPRLGGIALVIAFLLVEIVIGTLFPEPHRLREHLVFAGTSLAMFFLGFRDDLKPLQARAKLLGQVLIAGLVGCFGMGIVHFKIPFSGPLIALGVWGIPATILWLVAMTNLINLIDGADGLAAGICLMLMVLLACAGHPQNTFQFVAADMAGALLAFLWFNFPPARIYLGDGGAYFLGFQIGFISLVAFQQGAALATLTAPLLVLALPIADALLVLLRRGLRGLPIFRPDRKHIHHRLIAIGFSRRKMVLWVYAITTLFLILALLVMASDGQLFLFAIGMTVLVLVICAGKLSFSREWFAVGRVLGASLEMRREVRYALALVRWFGLDGECRHSLEEVWNTLIFVAQRLGFSFVRLTLADGSKVWHNANHPATGPWHHYLQELPDGSHGWLELKAPARMVQAGPAMPGAKKQGHGWHASISNPKLFEILSELLVEGWLQATRERDFHLPASLKDDVRADFPSPDLDSQSTKPRELTPA